jgi:hypothetical protein
VTEYIWGEDGEQYELVDESGLSTEDRLLALEAAVAAEQAYAAGDIGYEDEGGYYDDEYMDEEAWLDELSGDLAFLQEQLGRDLTDQEIDMLTGFAETTGVMPSTSYGEITPHLNLANEDDRINYSAALLDQDQARQERQEQEEAAGFTSGESAAHMLAESADSGYDEGDYGEAGE